MGEGYPGLAFIGLAYGFASLAMDSAHLLEYALAVIFVWFAVKHARHGRAVRVLQPGYGKS